MEFRTEIPEELIAELTERVLERVQPSPAEEDRWLNTEQAAEHLGSSPGRIHNLTSSSNIPFHKEGSLSFSRRDRDKWVKSGRAAHG